MNDRWEHTITANKAFASRDKLQLQISPGVLTKLIIFFPAGCQSLARCRVFLGQKPVAPRSAAHYLAGDNLAIVLDQMDESIKENLPELNWELWNIDDTYSHTLWLLAEWISEDEPYAMKTYRVTRNLASILTRMFRAIGLG